jgi:hypothetical protein
MILVARIKIIGLVCYIVMFTPRLPVHKSPRNYTKLIQVRLMGAIEIMGARKHACYVYVFGVKRGYHPLPLRALFVSLLPRDSLSFRLIFSLVLTLT